MKNNSSWVISESIKGLIIKTSMSFSIDLLTILF